MILVRYDGISFQNAGVVVLTNGIVYDFNPFREYFQIRLGIFSFRKCDMCILINCLLMLWSIRNHLYSNQNYIALYSWTWYIWTFEYFHFSSRKLRDNPWEAICVWLGAFTALCSVTQVLTFRSEITWVGVNELVLAGVCLSCVPVVCVFVHPLCRLCVYAFVEFITGGHVSCCIKSTFVLLHIF